jgi:hypothetical protein
MSGDLQSRYGKAQRETAELLGYDLACLTPDQSLRLDCAVALRLALDDLQGRIVRGESIDVNRMLTAAEALGRLLPPAVLSASPPAQRSDPREALLRMYLEMRERGEIGEGSYDGAMKRIAELEAENERLRSGDKVIIPSESDIIPPSEIGETYAGFKRGPDDPPRRSPPLIEGKASAQATTANGPRPFTETLPDGRKRWRNPHGPETWEEPLPNTPPVQKPGWLTKLQADLADAKGVDPRRLQPDGWGRAGGSSSFTVNGMGAPATGQLMFDGSWRESATPQPARNSTPSTARPRCMTANCGVSMPRLRRQALVWNGRARPKRRRRIGRRPRKRASSCASLPNVLPTSTSISRLRPMG